VTHDGLETNMKTAESVNSQALHSCVKQRFRSKVRVYSMARLLPCFLCCLVVLLHLSPSLAQDPIPPTLPTRWPGPITSRLKIENTRFVTQEGERVFFNGVNQVSIKLEL
jgi:hypothetical protein